MAKEQKGLRRGVILTDTWPWWWVWCRFLCRAGRWCCTWMVEEDGACVCDRIPAVEGCSAAVLRASPTWLQSPHTGFCCPWSIAAKHIQPSRLNQFDYRERCTSLSPNSGLWNTPYRFWHSIRRSVDCWRHTPGTPRHKRGRPLTGSRNLASPHGADVRRRGREGRWRDHCIAAPLSLYCVAALGPYQQVLLLTINISCVNGIQRLVVLSNSPLPLVWMKNRY